jgi:hypothetical protein
VEQLHGEIRAGLEGALPAQLLEMAVDLRIP